jgi:arylsulfatase A-like enzyme
MITRRSFLKAGAAVGAGSLIPKAFAGGVHTGTKDGRPNILFIFTDQQTINCMSAAGNPWVQTPNIDSLARFGVRFEKSVCTSPICTPSRGTLVTGVMPHNHGAVYNNTGCDWDNVPRMGKLFKDAGYDAVWGGKWHLPESYPVVPNSKYSNFVPDFELLPFYTSGVETPGMHWALGDYTDGPLADAVEQWFADRDSRKPWMFGVSFHNPHDICYFPGHPEMYPDPLNIAAAPPLPENFEFPDDEPEFLVNARQRDHYGNEVRAAQKFDADQWRRYIYNYYRMMERVDEQIGRVLRALEKSGQEENTLIIFTSDHGDGAASHRWAAKLSLYAEPVNVPFIVTQFGKTPAGVVDSDHLVSGLDVLPTMLDYAGTAIPSACQGRSLKPVVEGRTTGWRDFVVTELAIDPRDPVKQGRMLRTARYKYNVYGCGARNEQFFDLNADPGEMTSLISKPELQTEIERHRNLLKQWMEETNDPFEVQA